MAIRNIRHPEWLASHDPTKYPFTHTASLRNDEGDIIFEGTFLDASFYPINGRQRMYLSVVVVTPDTVTIVIGDDFVERRAFGEFERSAPPDILRFIDIHGRPAGVIVSESARLSLFGGWSVGEHVFAQDQTELVARCCIPTPGVGFRGFELDSGEVVTEDIWLVGDDGVVLSCEKADLIGPCGEPTETVDVVRIDIVGDPLFRRRLCTEPGLFETPQFLETITFCSPGYPGRPGKSAEEGTAVADILLLTDTTASMGEYIDTIKTIFGPLAAEVEAALTDTDLHWGVVDHKDFEDGGQYDNGYNLGSPFNDDPGVAQVAIDDWSALGGDDELEQQIATLKLMAELWTSASVLSGRAGAQKLIVWAGDAGGWVDGAKGLPYPSLAAAISALQDKGIKIIGVNVRHPEQGIDTGDQASEIIAACGGVLLDSIAAEDAETIKDLLVENIAREILSGSPGIPGRDQACHVCGPGEFGNINISVGSQQAPDTILRVRSVAEGMIIEAVGETLEDVR